MGACTLGLVLVWYGATSEVPWLFLLAAWLWALAGVGFVYALWNQRGLRPHLEVLASRPAEGSPSSELPDQMLRTSPWPSPVFEGDGLEVELGIDNAGAARGPAWLQGRLGAMDFQASTAIVRQPGWRQIEALRQTSRGPLDATSWVIGSSDPLGFFRSRRACPRQEVAVILPRFASLAGHAEVRELEASLVAPRSGSGNELFGVREYTHGDPLRRIHWRSSARRGELVVREYEPPGAQTLGIFCEPAPPSVEVADQIARIAASEAWDCISDGGRVFLWSPGLESTQPSEARNFWALLEWLARYPGPAAAFPFDPPRVSDAVAVVGGPNAAISEALEDARRRGAPVRAWMVGDHELQDELDVDGVAQRVGTAWPL